MYEVGVCVAEPFPLKIIRKIYRIEYTKHIATILINLTLTLRAGHELMVTVEPGTELMITALTLESELVVEPIKCKQLIWCWYI